MLVRVRLRFQSTPSHYAQKCWFTFDKEQCKIVGDVAYLISSQFGFSSHKNELQLFMDDFLVPKNEKADVFRDNDIIEVKSVCVRSNGMVDSSSSATSTSSDSSISEVLPPAPKRIKQAVKKSPPKIRATKNTIPVVPTKKTASKEPPKPKPVKSKPVNPVKKLHVSEKKTASGGVHLTFNSADSSSESSSSDDSSDDETPAPSIKTSKPKPVSPVKSVKPPVKPAELPASTRGGKQARGKGRGRRQKRSFPSNIVIGGPDDIHTTRSTVYTNTGGEQSSASKSALVDNDTSTDQTATGWDVQPDKEPPVVAVKDYSNYPNLDGAPRVGDQLAFKLLELSGSCTPEVSQYKLASVVGYNSTAKTVIVRYQEPSKTTAANNASSELAQFALEQEAIIEQECPEVVLELASLISPKLVNA